MGKPKDNQMTPEDVTEQVGAGLSSENGGDYGFVCIWREKGDPLDDGSDHARYGITVGQWLSQEENQAGTWFVDGGWGGPPGAIHVRWNEDKKVWDNGGFCGFKFKDLDNGKKEN